MSDLWQQHHRCKAIDRGTQQSAAFPRLTRMKHPQQRASNWQGRGLSCRQWRQKTKRNFQNFGLKFLEGRDSCGTWDKTQTLPDAHRTRFDRYHLAIRMFLRPRERGRATWRDNDTKPKILCCQDNNALPVVGHSPEHAPPGCFPPRACQRVTSSVGRDKHTREPCQDVSLDLKGYNKDLQPKIRSCITWKKQAVPSGCSGLGCCCSPPTPRSRSTLGCPPPGRPETRRRKINKSEQATTERGPNRVQPGYPSILQQHWET